MNPTGARTVSGTLAAPLINLNGADNVTINGLGGGNSLTLENTSTAATASTIHLIGDASNNLVTNCTIKGASSAVTSGTIFIDTGTTTGNIGNIFSNNSITNSGANFPVNGIFSRGTSAAIFNSGTITQNNIQDYFSPTLATAGINLNATGNSAWSITGNKLFQTADRVYTTANTHSGIFIVGGAGYTISGNIIGFANAAGTGTTNTIGNSVALSGFPASYAGAGTANATLYRGINAAFAAAGAVSNIQGKHYCPDTTQSMLVLKRTQIFIGIFVNSGNANIGTTTGNTIGATSGGGGAPASIYTATTGSNGQAVGILAASTNTVSIQNNTLGSIDASGTSATIAGGFLGIQTQGGGGVVTTSNNTIGSATAQNIPNRLHDHNWCGRRPAL